MQFRINMGGLKTEKVVYFIVLYYLLLFNVLSSQTLQDNSFGLTILSFYGLPEVEENITAQLKAYPQEKIHLHTDRDVYVSGEKIWFKAYVVDAHTHLHPTHSQYVYVELISPADMIVSRVMIRPVGDMFQGHLPLSKFVSEGNYTLRAYTRYMENMGDDYFFKKNIRIGNLSSAKNQQQQTVQKTRRRTQTKQDDFDVSFFPEGGNLREGIICKVAFKAMNKNGYPEPVSGIVTDENGLEITSVQTYHAGMGVFLFAPERGKKYVLKCSNENGVEKQFVLPEASPMACSLTASMFNKKMLISIQRSAQAPDISFNLLAHCRGNVLYFSEWDKNKGFLTFDEEQFPAGVIQFVLFDGQMNPLSERLIFSKNDASAKVEFRTDKEIYEKRDKIAATIKLDTLLFPSLRGNAGVGLEGWGGASAHFSVAITDDQDIAVDEYTTIQSSLLLSSELKGYIENPSYYLHDPTAMDLLMMTHGWRRYNIPEVVKGNMEFPQIPYQTSQEISGKVQTLAFAKPVAGSEINIMSIGGAGTTSTDENGKFIFGGFEHPDSTTYWIQALDRRGKSKVELVVNSESFHELTYAPQSRVRMPEIPVKEAEIKNELDTDVFLEKAELRSMFDEDIRRYDLNEVVITAQNPITEKESRLQVFPLNEHSDVTLTREVFEKIHRTEIFDHLATIPGVWVKDGEIIIRNSRNIRGIIPPLLLIDGIVSDLVMIRDIPILFVESIDVFKGPSTAIFGARGMGGVISITLKRGADFTAYQKDFNYAVYTPLGYQKPIEFYAPKYETVEAKRSFIPDYRTTIFWKPDVVISEDGEATFEFYTADFKTTYSVVIEGITTDGKIVRQVEKIRVE